MREPFLRSPTTAESPKSSLRLVRPHPGVLWVTDNAYWPVLCCFCRIRTPSCVVHPVINLVTHTRNHNNHSLIQSELSDSVTENTKMANIEDDFDIYGEDEAYDIAQVSSIDLASAESY